MLRCEFRSSKRRQQCLCDRKLAPRLQQNWSGLDATTNLWRRWTSQRGPQEGEFGRFRFCFLRRVKAQFPAPDAGNLIVEPCIKAADLIQSDEQHKTAPSISVGTRTPRKRYRGEIPVSPKRDARIDGRSGFGEFAITVSPPPATAPASPRI